MQSSEAPGKAVRSLLLVPFVDDAASLHHDVEDAEPIRKFLNLHHAAAVGSIPGCAYALDVEGVDVNEINDFDESALYCARYVHRMLGSEFRIVSCRSQLVRTLGGSSLLAKQRSACRTIYLRWRASCIRGID
jgi:hypothetical protein